MDKTIRDIRNQAYLTESEVLKLNFINDSSHYIFRKYYRSGLRSHIFEILAVEDVLKETKGEIIDGIRMFPRAKPKKIFRILRNRFKNKEAVFEEIKKYHLLLQFLGPDCIAQSEEVIVDYTAAGKNHIVLCGLQEYIEGEILDPWRQGLSCDRFLLDMFKSTTGSGSQLEEKVKNARINIDTFVQRTRQMIAGTGYIPDLAGLGNLILNHEGNLKLVDINNIVKIKFNDIVAIDDKGYPSCDVSVEVLSILERDILKKHIQTDDPLYQLFLSPERKIKVKALEKKFYKSL
ncbi:MAG: hypothetical protein HOG03_04210 [Desulfobacula sp.]|jgi:hypothetical protein|uniref:hypothetical protein n=1 Tax=Desulfobacula sp. TaxID=2593537 RepID=UPI001DE46CE8|nr:hypothetical protein [Desulfobacula sp.]MBT3485364.1 hypothetical protein [Desulfobacula sp.]MBT3803784.1 hypothetical protein [Desulfobacula sp.]MBT4026618.1 hypothetical protein [Desulfobacula sp.]MBT4200529.1 hypothetical protein [Desulfobacula sp.]